MTFAGSEIVEIAIQIEINGQDFYNIVAKNTKNEKIKDVFIYLAGEEEKHAATFRKILSTIKRYEPKEAYPEEYFSYMRTLAENKVFTQKGKGKEAAENLKNEKEGINIGINAEKYSITFYEGMKKTVSAEDGYIIDVIIKEEEKHLETLRGLKEEL